MVSKALSSKRRLGGLVGGWECQSGSGGKWVVSIGFPVVFLVVYHSVFGSQRVDDPVSSSFAGF